MIRSLPTSFGLSVRDRDPGLHPRLDDHRWHVAVVPPEHLAHLVQHGRHGRAQRDPADVRVLEQRALCQQALQDDRELVGRPDRVGGDPPVLDDLVALEHAEHRVGVPTSIVSSIALPWPLRSAGAFPVVGRPAPGKVIGMAPSTGDALSISLVVPTDAATSSSAAPVVAVRHLGEHVRVRQRQVVERSGGSAVAASRARARGGAAPRRARPARPAGRPAARAAGPARSPARRPTGTCSGWTRPARPASRTIGHRRDLDPQVEVGDHPADQRSCWASFSPNTAVSGRTSWNSLSTTVSTPSKKPGRTCPPAAAPAGPGSTLTMRLRRVHLRQVRREHEGRALLRADARSAPGVRG